MNGKNFIALLCFWFLVVGARGEPLAKIRDIRDIEINPLLFMGSGGTNPGLYILRGAITEIKFSADSDLSAKNTLYALRENIFNFNTDASEQLNIYVYGYFEPAASRKAGQPPVSENCTLLGWYIRAPFIEVADKEPRTRYGMRLAVRSKLTKDMFDLEKFNAEERKLIEQAKIEFDSRLNIFWIGIRPPILERIEAVNSKVNK